MWYESQMIRETLDSLSQALQQTKEEVKLIFCLNSQTYIEKPNIGRPEDMFELFIDHPILKSSELVYKTDNDPFYNIGDWRRDIYSDEYKYTCWGESDCLIPNNYFSVLETVNIKDPHILSFASRKCWDRYWYYCEHFTLKDLEPVDIHRPEYQEELIPLRFFDQITQEQLDEFNNKFTEIVAARMPFNQVDGALLALSANLPKPFIPDDMHFAREDLCASLFFSKKNIQQFCIITHIKGHNYNHPLKRMNTNNTRSDDIYQEYVRESEKAMNRFLLTVT